MLHAVSDAVYFDQRAEASENVVAMMSGRYQIQGRIVSGQSVQASPLEGDPRKEGKETTANSVASILEKEVGKKSACALWLPNPD